MFIRITLQKVLSAFFRNISVKMIIVYDHSFLVCLGWSGRVDLENHSLTEDTAVYFLQCLSSPFMDKDTLSHLFPLPLSPLGPHLVGCLILAVFDFVR